MNRQRLISCLTLALALLASGPAALAQFLPGGGIDTPDPVLPPDGVYLSPDDVHAMYTGANLAIVLTAIQHQPFKDLPPRRFPPPAGPDELHDFDSDLDGMAQCIGQGCNDFGIPSLFPVTMGGRVQTLAIGKGPSDTTGQWPVEMLAMSLQGEGLTPPSVMIRESPTLPSLGQTRITDIGGGLYHIDSFFDVFTELSLDGGMTWMPSAGPTHVNLVPEPASIVLIGMSVLGLAGLIRRLKVASRRFGVFNEKDLLMSKRLLLIVWLSAVAMFADGSRAMAQFLPGGGVDTTDPELPPPGVYLSPQDVHAQYSGPNLLIVLQAIQHQPFKDLDPAHLPDATGVTNEHHDFDSDLRGQAQCIGQGCNDFGIPPTFPVVMGGRVQTVSLNKGPSDTTGTFATEMLAMSLSGEGPTPPFVMVRESPTLPSLGQTRITDIGGGLYHIDSFFDVFTELSFDGGANWFPSLGPTNVNLVPEPSSAVLALLALIGAAGFGRRRK